LRGPFLPMGEPGRFQVAAVMLSSSVRDLTPKSFEGSEQRSRSRRIPMKEEFHGNIHERHQIDG
jgi:hypothetical protein